MTRDGERVWILGIDLGAASVGWAAVEAVHDRRMNRLRPTGLLDAGVRIFEAGVEGDIEAGKDASRAVVRREARQPRRQNWRTQFRKQKLFQQLQSYGLLPPSPTDLAAELDAVTGKNRKHAREASVRSRIHAAVFESLDRELTAQHLPNADLIDDPAAYHQLHQKLPYLLRAEAAGEPVDGFTLGRALYHIAQRRGFLSNRKSEAAEDEEAGKVQSAINDFHAVMGDRTFAETVVAELKPADGPSDEAAGTDGKIRGRYLSRHWMQKEFDRIRKTQQPHHDLSDDDWEILHKTIFFQRPLKSQRGRIGRCELEPGKPRADIARPCYQMHRLLHAVNSLRYRVPDGPDQALSDGQRQKLIDTLTTDGDQSFTKVRKLVGLDKGVKFTVEEWGEKRVVGHRTNAKLAPIFGEQWWQMSEDGRDAIALEVLHYRKADALRRRAVDVWQLPAEAAEELSRVRLEEGTGRHSRKALDRLNAAMADGTPYATARKSLYPERLQSGHVFDRLPPLAKVEPDINNPAVIRALTELRKVVNELVARYGKPAVIRTETARELKQSRQRRIDNSKQMRQNESRREKAVEAMQKCIPGFQPKRSDIRKWLLAEECGWVCPYTGKQISGRSLIGPNPQFDVEHIFPRRYLDDSMANKTLCDLDFNRNSKRDRIPRDCFPEDDPRLEEMLQRVRNFNGPYHLMKAKLKRFEATEVEDSFTNRHLSDTRYNAVIAARYLGHLYGGRTDDQGVQRVFTPAGGLTWMLRTGWELDGLLSDDGTKQRDDHRHHAIDAFIAACSDQQRIQACAEAAADAEKRDSRRFLKAVREPWAGFDNELQQVLEDLVVSHRPTRSISGPMHAETFYSPEKTTIVLGDDGKPLKQTDKKTGEEVPVTKTSHHVRKRVDALSAAELKGDDIVDPVVRRQVLAKLEQLGESNASKAFADPANHPTMPAKDGQLPVPIHRVRVRAKKSARPVGNAEHRRRLVASGKDSNYASMVYATLDKEGRETKWTHEIIDRLTAYQRLSDNKNRTGEKVLIPDEQGGKRRFKFALVKNDTIELDGTGELEGERVLYRVQKLSEREIQLCPLSRPSRDNKTRTSDDRITSVDRLRKRHCDVISVSPSGTSSKSSRYLTEVSS